MNKTERREETNSHFRRKNHISVAAAMAVADAAVLMVRLRRSLPSARNYAEASACVVSFNRHDDFVS